MVDTSMNLSLGFLPETISYIRNITCPPSKAGIGNTFIKAKIIEISAVDSQKPFQSHFAGKILPIVPKPPSCDAPFFVKTNENPATYSYNVQ